MRATVTLDDELVRKAQELSGVTERSALLRAALKALIHIEASRRLAAVGGTEPNLEKIKRARAGNPGAGQPLAIDHSPAGISLDNDAKNFLEAE